MTLLLQDKSLSTKFQILVEIAANQPYIRQTEIAKRINLTPQAVSSYIRDMVKDGWVLKENCSNHLISREGLNWLLKTLRDTQNYLDLADKVTRNAAICTAVAHCHIAEGETIGLVMKNGLLRATRYQGKGAKGVAVLEASEGEDVGITNIEGIISLELGEVIILSIPGIQRGGSRRVDLKRLETEIGTKKDIGAIGIEAMIALKKIGITAQYICGVNEVAAEAARRGLSMKVVCVNSEIPYLVQSLEEKHLAYKLVELEKTVSS